MTLRIFLLLLIPAVAAAQVQLKKLPATAPAGQVEIRGVAAGAFNPELWDEGTLHFVPDMRSPLIEPLPGNCRNIYAPTAVQVEGGWRIYYGAWDGIPTGNDCIYTMLTPDFRGFTDRHMVIHHGAFQHVCNVNALRLDDGSFAMVCTAYPDKDGLNKPVFYTSPDGRKWQGSDLHRAEPKDIISVDGYDKYPAADINGMNVILHEDGKYRLYFGNFKDFGRTYRASSEDGREWTFDGPAQDGALMVNDVKKFRVGARTHYLMGLHHNGDELLYALSTDGAKFSKARSFLSNLGAEDRYIVALGWVVSGEQEKPGRTLLGVLYGAGDKKSLDANRIFARWLQKKLVWVTKNGRRDIDRSLGPDRAVLQLDGPETGRFEMFSEDGRTPLGRSQEISLDPDCVYAF